MKVLVIGGSGFIGSHTADILSERGHEVTIFDKVPSKYIKDNQKMAIGNIENREQIDYWIKGMDIVYNFAARKNIDDKFVKDIIDTNIIGNINIIDACVKYGIKRYIFASTIYVYSNKGSFYRISKQTGESLIDEYNRLHGMPYTILRYGSVYGPRSDDSNWIHKIIHQALTEKKIVRMGDGEEIREYIYVKDAAKLSVDILDKQYENQSIILTGIQSIKIRELHEIINEILDNKISLEYININVPKYHFNITPYTFNIKPAKKLVNNPSYDLGQGILECIDDIYRTL